jgi:hypothetical protein
MSEEKVAKESQIDFLMKNIKEVEAYLEARGLHQMGEIVKNILVGLKTTENSFGFGFAIISGCGGSGKTKVEVAILDYLKEKGKSEYTLIATDENTSTDSLLCRVSADSLMSTEGEKYVVGELGKALQDGRNILWDEINRTPFENIQKMMTLFSERKVTHRDTEFCIPDGMIILATANLGSKGTFPIAQEFKQRSSIVEVKYTPAQMSKIAYAIFDKDARRIDLGMKLYAKTAEYAKEGRNGWNYEASVRTVKTFVDRLLLSLDFGLDIETSVYQAIRSVLIQFTDESSVFIQRKNAEIAEELQPDIKTILNNY